MENILTSCTIMINKIQTEKPEGLLQVFIESN